LAKEKAKPVDEAPAWLILADALEQANDLKAAEHAMTEAYRLQVLNHDPAIEITRAKLAELEFLKGNPAVALELLDSALSHRTAILAEIPEHQILYRRAQMLAALDRRQEALSLYRQAVAAATRWRSSERNSRTTSSVVRRLRSSL
jgi:tetratricopeptide (TPR) repeat protein